MSSPSPHTDADTTDDGRPTLAQELLDLILDHLHNDSESLKQSALASKSLLSTCQRHLFSTYQITKFKLIKLAELFASPSLNDGNDEGASLRARVTDLLNTYTTNLILTDYPRPFSGYGMKKAHLPEFKNVQKITFKGDGLNSAIVIPPFLMQTWMASSPRLRSVEFDFLQIHEKAILESFYLIPSTVEEVSFIYATTEYGRRSRLAASLVREGTEDQLLPVNSSPGVYYPSGTPNLEDLLPIILELKDLFKFSLKRLSYRPTDRASIDHLGSLVDECKNTLQFLDITVSHSAYYVASVRAQPFDFSHHHTLRRIRVWISAAHDPGWLCAAISSIPTPSSTTPRVPHLRIEIHISLPHPMMYPNPERPYMSRSIDEVVTPWIAVDTQLSRLMGLNPDTLSATSAMDGTTTGILLDISIPELTTGPGKGVAALMFPLLSSVKGLVRLV